MASGLKLAGVKVPGKNAVVETSLRRAGPRTADYVNGRFG